MLLRKTSLSLISSKYFLFRNKNFFSSSLSSYKNLEKKLKSYSNNDNKQITNFLNNNYNDLKVWSTNGKYKQVVSLLEYSFNNNNKEPLSLSYNLYHLAMLSYQHLNEYNSLIKLFKQNILADKHLKFDKKQKLYLLTLQYLLKKEKFHQIYQFLLINKKIMLSNNKKLYHDILKSLIHYNKVKLIINLFKSYPKTELKKLELNTFLFNLILNKLKKLNQMNDAEYVLYNLMIKKCNIKPDIITFNTLLDLYAINNDIKSSLELINKIMPKYHLQANIWSYNTLMKIYGNMKQIDQAYAIFIKLKQKDQVSYNIVMDIYRKIRNIKQVEHIFKLLLNDVDNKPSIYSYNILIASYGLEIKGLLANKQYKKAIQVLHYILNIYHYNQHIDATSFCTLITILNMFNKIHDIQQYYQQYIKQYGYNSLDINSYETLLQIYIKENYQLAIDLLHDIHIHATKITMNELCKLYHIFIQYHCQLKQYDQAITLINTSMNKKNIKPSYENYTYVIHQLISNQHIDQAYNVVKELLSKTQQDTTGKNISIDQIFTLYHLILHAYCKINQCNQAYLILKEFLNHQSIIHDLKLKKIKILLIKSFNIIINGYINQKKKFSVDHILTIINNDFQQYQLKKDIFTYNSLLKMYCKINDIKQAAMILHNMKTPNITSYLIIFEQLSKLGKYEIMKKFLSNEIEMKINKSIELYNILFKCYNKLRLANESQVLFDDLLTNKEQNIQPDRYTYNTIISTWTKCNNIDQANHMLKMMKKNNIQPDDYTYAPFLQYAKDKIDLKLFNLYWKKMELDHVNKTKFIYQLESDLLQKIRQQQ